MSRTLLVILPNWVGDCVMATPALRALRRGLPGARIAILGKPRLLALLDGLTSFDETFPSAVDSARGLLGAARILARRRFDVAVILRHSMRSALLAWLAGIPRRVGYRAQGRGALLTDPVRAPRAEGRRIPEPMPVSYRRLVEVLGCAWRGDAYELAVPEAFRDLAEERARALGLAPGEMLIGLNPGASFGASKLWAPERFAAAADALHARLGLRSIVFVAPGEEGIARAILEAARSPVIDTSPEPLDLALLKPFVARCRILVTTDTGTRHVATAFGVPTVVVMGPTDPRYTAVNLERTVVIRRDVECGSCHRKVCPIDHRCMEWIQAEEVAEAALRLLNH